MRYTLVLLALLTGAVHAQGPSALYIAPQIGASMMDDADVDDPFITALGLDAELEMDAGAYLGIALGRDLYPSRGHPVRIEAVLMHRENDIDTITFTGPGGSATCEQGGISCSGDVESNVLLANVWYDFNREASLRPYIGGGIGFANVDGTLRVTDPITGVTETGSGDDNVIAYQIGAGVGYAFTERVMAALDFR
ncbi:MAG: porin family protein, partial [Gammaproteobacteria bacterium]|nr:porin family protein [Gammaproteobacteria bacterium]NIR83255.1 porin family protein [Gammaproteobacteria bacterium]